VLWPLGVWILLGHWALGRVLWGLGIGSCGLGTGLLALVEHWPWAMVIVMGPGHWVVCFGDWALGLVVSALGFALG
jgi:hypothetical protein